MNIGDKAPEVLGINEKGEEILLSNYQGKKVVLYFYPKDNTSGCTAEACSLRDNYAELKAKGYEVIGVSVDNEKISDFTQQFEKASFADGLILRRGKKNYHKLVFKS